jgi:hypothetical protein
VDILLGIASSSLRVEKNKKALETFNNILKIDPPKYSRTKRLRVFKNKKAR